MSARRIRGLAVLAVAAAAALPSSLSAAEPILPLDQVRAGMQGEALTVIKGTEIVRFPVTVTDVQPGPDRAGGPLILVRAEGSMIRDLGGIAQGMSGSPVYVTGADGVRRVIGALAYGQGDEANLLGAITPIERMVALTQEGRQLSRPRVAAARPLRVVADREQAVRATRRTPAVRTLYPLQHWGVSGIDPRVAPALSRRLGTGVQLQQSLPRSLRAPVTLEPGSSVAAMAMGGDITLGAIGTVTWRDGDRIAAFGHPFTGGGDVKLLMGDAYIYNVVGAPTRGESFKFGEPGGVQGMFTVDRTDGVAGTVGGTDGAIRVRTTARDVGRGRTADLDILMSPQPELAPMLGDTLQLEPLVRARDGILSGTLQLRVVMRGGDLPRPIVYRNVYASAGDVINVSAGVVERFLTILMANSVRQLRPGQITITQTLTPKISAVRLLHARVHPVRARPGQRVRVELTMRRYRGGVIRRRVLTRLPAGLGPGLHTIRIIPANTEGFDSEPADLSGALLGDSLSTSAVRVRRQRLRAQLRAATTPARVRRLLRAANALVDRHDMVRLLGSDDFADERGTGHGVVLPGLVVYGGSAAFRVRVLRQPPKQAPRR